MSHSGEFLWCHEHCGISLAPTCNKLILKISIWIVQGAKINIIFTACHSGKLKLAFTSPDVILTSPESFLTSRIDFTVLPLFKLLKKHHLPIRQVKNRIH